MIQFDPRNKIVQMCLKANKLFESENYKETEAIEILNQALNIAENDFEKYLATYFIARSIKSDMNEKLKWFEKALKLALASDDVAVKSAIPLIYNNISYCYFKMQDYETSEKYATLNNEEDIIKYETGPFYHGTRAELKIGDFLVPNNNSNYRENLEMNHIYFTALPNGAGLASELAKGEGKPRVYKVEPTGEYEYDPNLTNRKFPGNPTRSYRSLFSLKIVGEVTDWNKQSEEELNNCTEKIKNNNGEIIN